MSATEFPSVNNDKASIKNCTFINNHAMMRGGGLAIDLGTERNNFVQHTLYEVIREANELIGRYSGSFPTQEEGFWVNVAEGQTVTIGCWIGETTTARYIKQ